MSTFPIRKASLSPPINHDTKECKELSRSHSHSPTPTNRPLTPRLSIVFTVAPLSSIGINGTNESPSHRPLNGSHTVSTAVPPSPRTSSSSPQSSVSSIASSHKVRLSIVKDNKSPNNAANGGAAAGSSTAQFRTKLNGSNAGSSPGTSPVLQSRKEDGVGSLKEKKFAQAFDIDQMSEEMKWALLSKIGRRSVVEDAPPVLAPSSPVLSLNRPSPVFLVRDQNGGSSDSIHPPTTTVTVSSPPNLPPLDVITTPTSIPIPSIPLPISPMNHTLMPPAATDDTSDGEDGVVKSFRKRHHDSVELRMIKQHRETITDGEGITKNENISQETTEKEENVKRRDSGATLMAESEDIDKDHCGGVKDDIVTAGDSPHDSNRRIVQFNLSSLSTITTQNIKITTTEREAMIAELNGVLTPKKGILKKRVRKETFEEVMARIMAEREKERHYLHYMSEGAICTKYSTDGKPLKRCFFVSPDGDQIVWTKVDGNKKPPSPFKIDSKTGEVMNKKKSSLPSFRILSWKVNKNRSRSLGDIIGCHYGPYASKNFHRYVEWLDGSNGKPWLCLSMEFVDRSIDIVCETEEQITMWFLGIQSMSPLTVHYLSHGALLWQRTIMKLNYYGLEACATGKLKEREIELQKHIQKLKQFHGLK